MTIKKLVGISLALVMLVGSVPLGFSEPLRVQLEQGIDTDQIQCDNDSHVLVERTNGKMACVTERTVERLGWEVINNSSIKQIKDSDSIPIKRITVTWPQDLALGMEVHSREYSQWPQPITSITFPEEVKVGEEFTIDYSWTFVILDEDDSSVIDEIITVPKDYPGVKTLVAASHSAEHNRVVATIVSENPDQVYDKSFSKTFKYDTISHTEKVKIIYLDIPEFWENSIRIGIADTRYEIWVIPNGSNELLLTTDGNLESQYAKEWDAKQREATEDKGLEYVPGIPTYGGHWPAGYNPVEEPEDDVSTSSELVEFAEDEWALFVESMQEFSKTDPTVSITENMLRATYTEESVDRFLEVYPEFKEVNVTPQSFEFSLFDYVLPKAYSQTELVSLR